MGEINYYESRDSAIVVTDQFVHLYHHTLQIEEINSCSGMLTKPDQMLNVALAFIGVFCIFLGKIRAGHLEQMIDIQQFFQATNYFELTGLVFILVALLLTLPQREQAMIQLNLKNGRLLHIQLLEPNHCLDLKEIDKAINQSLRYLEYRHRIS